MFLCIVVLLFFSHGAMGACAEPGGEKVCSNGQLLTEDKYGCKYCKPCFSNYYCFVRSGDLVLAACPNDAPFSNPGAKSISDCYAGVKCNPGYYLTANGSECVVCPSGSYCPGGTYEKSSVDVGRNACPNGETSPSGAKSVGECGRKLHVGDYFLYMRSAKNTAPALNLKIGSKTYYADMFKN